MGKQLRLLPATRRPFGKLRRLAAEVESSLKAASLCDDFSSGLRTFYAIEVETAAGAALDAVQAYYARCR